MAVADPPSKAAITDAANVTGSGDVHVEMGEISDSPSHDARLHAQSDQSDQSDLRHTEQSSESAS